MNIKAKCSEFHQSYGRRHQSQKKAQTKPLNLDESFSYKHAILLVNNRKINWNFIKQASFFRPYKNQLKQNWFNQLTPPANIKPCSNHKQGILGIALTLVYKKTGKDWSKSKNICQYYRGRKSWHGKQYERTPQLQLSTALAIGYKAAQCSDIYRSTGHVLAKLG